MADDRFGQGSAGMRAGAASGPETAAVLARWRKRAGVSRQRLADLSDVSATYVRTIEAGVDDQGREVVPSAAIMQKLARGLASVGSAPGDEPEREGLEQQIYSELLGAAGYLPAGSAPPAMAPAAPVAGAASSRVMAVPLEQQIPAAGDALASHDAPASHDADDPRGEGVEPGRGERPSAAELGRRLADYARVQGTYVRAEAVRAAASAIATAMWRDQRLWQHARPLFEQWEELKSDDQALLLGIMAWVHERYQSSQDRHSGGR